MVNSRFLTVILIFCASLSWGCAHSGSDLRGRSGLLWSGETGPINAGHFRCVALADLDNDGFQDLAAGSFLPGGVVVWRGNGQGKWRPAARPPVMGDVRSVALCDVNGDGRRDMVLGGQQDLKGVLVLLQEVDGSWKFGNSPAEAGSYESVQCVDINGDEHLDLVAANSSGDLNGGIQVWFGDGKGSWTQEAGPDSAHIYRDVAVADINRDGNLDIAATSWGHPGGIRIFAGSGDGAWSALPSPAAEGDFWGLVVADLNGDGILDLAATSYYQGIKVWQGDAKGGWQEMGFPVDRGFYWDLAASDFNGDGNMDLAASSVTSRGVRLFLGRSLGGWLTVSGALPESGSFYGMAAADIDGDGRDDLVAASYSEGVHAWFAGRGTAAAAEAVEAGAGQGEAAAEPYLAVTRFGIPFETGGTELAEAAKTVIAEAVKSLRESPYETVRIEGHADSGETPGDKESLMGLSEARARKVQELLSGRLSLDPSRVTVTGFADSRNLDASMAHSGAGNVRVDVIVTHVRSVDDGLPPDEGEKKREEEFRKEQSAGGYKVGPGDILKIVFWKQFSADEYEVMIRPDGTLSFSMVDNVKVSGLTTTELDNLLTEKLSRYFKNPRIDIMVKEYHSQEVLVMGAINSLVRQPTGPGVYILKKPTRIVELLTVAGGPRPTANLKRVAVTRKNGTTVYLNLYKAIFQSDASQDIPIYPGDTIFVPETSEGVSKVYVFGEVKNPGIYDLKEGMSVLEAIAKAGSFSDDAVIRSTKLVRGDLSKPEVIAVDLKRFFRTGDLSSNLRLENNDIIFVPKTRIASVAHFLKNLKPALDFVLFPYQFESLRTTIDLNKENVRPLTTQ